MIVANPCDWVLGRLKRHRPFFAIRLNDGEHTGMYRTRPEGTVLGTDVNPAPLHYAWGDALNEMVREMAAQGPKGLLIGCSWNTPRADDLARRFGEDVVRLGMKDFRWCNEHWPLDGVVDGSTKRLLEYIGEYVPTILVTNRLLKSARYCLDSLYLEAPLEDCWNQRENIYQQCRQYAQGGCTFVWAAGVGLKSTAWRLFKEFPQSYHIDVGHLFNGAFGLRDYGWLQRQDGPWWEPYMRKGGFKDWVLGEQQSCA